MAVTKLSLAELEAWTPQGTTVAFLGAHAGFYAQLHASVIEKIASSRPEMADWEVLVVEIDVPEIEKALKTLHARHVWAIVFTYPLKDAALQVMSPSLGSKGEAEKLGFGGADSLAERIGAVNLGIWRPGGYWGHSTDGQCFFKAMFEVLKIKLKTMTVFVVGTNPLARAIAVEALQQGCHSLWLGGKDPEKEWDMLDQIVPSPLMRGRTHTFNPLKLTPKVPKNGILVNVSTILGEEGMTFGLEWFSRTTFYWDTSIVPTQMIKDAEKRGMPTSMGRGFLANQIVLHIKLMADFELPFEMVLMEVNKAAATFIKR